MPYIIKQTKEKGVTGYKVCKLDNPKSCFSKHLLSEEHATKQRTAIILSELKRAKKHGGVGDTDTAHMTERDQRVARRNAVREAARLTELERATTPRTPTHQPPVTDNNEPPRVPTRVTTMPRTGMTENTRVRRTIMLPVPQGSDSSYTPSTNTSSSSSSGSSNRAGPSQPTRANRASRASKAGPTSKITPEQCHAFFNNPKKNPLTNANITFDGPKFNEILRACYGPMNHDDYLQIVEKLSLPANSYSKLIAYLKKQGLLVKDIATEEANEDEMCKKFLENPTKDPNGSKRKIGIGSKESDAYYKKCEKKLPADVFQQHLDVFIKEEIPDGIMGPYKCAKMIGSVQAGFGLVLQDYFRNSRIPIDHPIVKQLLKRCDKDFLMKIFLIKTLTGVARVNNISMEDIIVRYNVLKHDHTTNYVYILFPSYIVDAITRYIFDFRYNIEEKQRLLTNLINTIGELLNISTSDINESYFETGTKPKKVYIDGAQRDTLVSSMYELQALKHGIEIKISDESSSDRSSKRSRSISPKEGLASLPKNTRAQILDELERGCRDMRDNISFEDFEDMKKKKLQLIVKIGPKNGEGKQSCYYVKNIFKYVEKELANSKIPTDPYTRDQITPDAMKRIIMPKMRYVDINIVNPFEKRQGQKIPNIELVVKPNVDDLGRPFYTVGIRRRIGNVTDIHGQYERLGYIPANIYVDVNDRGDSTEHYTDVFSGETDVSSAVIMAKLSMLVDKGVITDIYGMPRVHINKSMNYWYDDNDEVIIKKAKKMIDEFDTYLS